MRQQLVSTRITNEDIIAFRQFELYNSVQQRLQNTKLSLACRHLNIQQRQYLWSELFLRATQEYNKYKGLLTYLEVRGTDFFKDFCSELEARITEHTTTINNAIDGCHLSPSQIDRIERVLHEEDTDVLNSPTAVQLIYARYTLGKSLTELHLLQENNYLKANSQHRIELHQYYQGLDLFQKQQLVDDIKKLVDLTRRLLTQPNLSARVVNKVIIRKISRAYYPDALYTSSQIEHAVCKIRRILSELDFSQFFLHRAVSGTLVNKFVSKILHAPRPFSNEDEFIESIVVSLISILGNKHIESLIQNTATMSGELRALCRREITRKLQGQINWMQFIKSRVNRNKRKDYQYAKTLHQSLVAD